MKFFFLLVMLCIGYGCGPCTESKDKCAERSYPRRHESISCNRGQRIELHEDIIICRCPPFAQSDVLIIDAGQ